MCTPKPKIETPEPPPLPPEAPRLPDQTPIEGERREAMGTLLTGGASRGSSGKTLLGSAR